MKLWSNHFPNIHKNCPEEYIDEVWISVQQNSINLPKKLKGMYKFTTAKKSKSMRFIATLIKKIILQYDI